MVKNITFNLYAITVSLPPEIGNDPPKYISFHDRLRKNTKCSCYVLETGKQGDHLHYHSFLHYNKDIRKDHLTAKVKKLIQKIFKVETILKPMVQVSPAYNPIYWIENYLTKESVPVTFDMDLKPYLQREQYYAINKLGNSLIPLHQGNLELALREYDDVPKQDLSISFFIKELESNLDKSGYQTKIFRSQPSFTMKTVLKIYYPEHYRRSYDALLDKILSRS